ncbi:MAG: lectin [Bernardetiaceae bacterium]|nr:lectin [Bernardetiaceae bacterium]
MKCCIFLMTFGLTILAFMPLQAQDFALMGTATDLKNDCILLTPDKPYQEGLAYHRRKIDLNQFFEIEFDVYFGDKDEGADGITFVIHNDPRGYGAYGTWGECMGYGRWRKNSFYGDYIAPSIAIEFDTYQNLSQNDPPQDHIAYLENGTNYHTTYFDNNDENFNLEDDRLHAFRLRWNPELHLLSVYLDEMLVYEGTKDLINEIFKGESQVIWGFTASTGRKHNKQYFCLRRWAKR